MSDCKVSNSFHNVCLLNHQIYEVFVVDEILEILIILGFQLRSSSRNLESDVVSFKVFSRMSTNMTFTLAK